ncbi:MAG: uracil phosphoribosyltransferase [Armatimonadota bacterium]
MAFHLASHPLADQWMTVLRDRTSDRAAFRSAAWRLSQWVALEATRDIPTVAKRVDTPLESTEGRVVSVPVTVVPILRAGLAMAEPILELFPGAAMGHVGLARDEATAEAAAYYCRLPEDGAGLVLVVDPMLATGGSLIAALDRVRASGAREIRALSLVAAPEGIAAVAAAHPAVALYGAAVDRELDERKYIRPGLGDFGDRWCGA